RALAGAARRRDRRLGLRANRVLLGPDGFVGTTGGAARRARVAEQTVRRRAVRQSVHGDVSTEAACGAPDLRGIRRHRARGCPRADGRSANRRQAPDFAAGDVSDRPRTHAKVNWSSELSNSHAPVSVEWCRTSRAATMKMTSSAIFVA